ncbi:MAG: energy-coupling factor ABC transporter substrate-binding protein [Clostridia bacterium]|nr:energy-coupling factor ABC transporter substrate-binding protein [Clostridia bacterium]
MMKLWQKNLLLFMMLILVVLVPMIIKNGAEFGGSDDKAAGVIEEIQSDYTPWFESIWEPPSGEIESLLFCAQAAFGAGIVGFVLGKITAEAKK